MRDDIHKSAPVNAGWRRHLKHCAREADREDRAAESAHQAAVADCNRELSAAFLAKLVERYGQSELFGGALDEVSGSRDLGGNDSILEQRVFEKLKSGQFALGVPGIEQATVEVLQEHTQAQGRALRGHVLKERGPGVAECVQAVNRGINSIPIAEIARQLIAKGTAKPSRVSSSAPDMDYNLLKGK